MSALDRPIPMTFFPNFGAAAKTEERFSLPDLAVRIRTTTGPDKAALPWLKLAQFGNAKTAKGSLRHDANLLAISGIEADYDGGQMDVDAALALLEQQGVASILYTSPSHTADAPRWRVMPSLRGHATRSALAAPGEAERAVQGGIREGELDAFAVLLLRKYPRQSQPSGRANRRHADRPARRSRCDLDRAAGRGIGIGRSGQRCRS